MSLLFHSGNIKFWDHNHIPYTRALQKRWNTDTCCHPHLSLLQVLSLASRRDCSCCGHKGAVAGEGGIFSCQDLEDQFDFGSWNTCGMLGYGECVLLSDSYKCCGFLVCHHVLCDMVVEAEDEKDVVCFWPLLHFITDLTEEVFTITEAMWISSKESRIHSRPQHTTYHVPLIESNLQSAVNSLKYFPFQGFISSLARPGNQDSSVSFICVFKMMDVQSRGSVVFHRRQKTLWCSLEIYLLLLYRRELNLIKLHQRDVFRAED